MTTSCNTAPFYGLSSFITRSKINDQHLACWVVWWLDFQLFGVKEKIFLDFFFFLDKEKIFLDKLKKWNAFQNLSDYWKENSKKRWFSTLKSQNFYFYTFNCRTIKLIVFSFFFLHATQWARFCLHERRIEAFIYKILICCPHDIFFKHLLLKRLKLNC